MSRNIIFWCAIALLIVTSAASGWIDASLHRYLPAIAGAIAGVLLHVIHWARIPPKEP